jgi:uncharacterized membrane protein
MNGYYEEEYGQNIFGNFDGMLQIILILGAICIVAGAVLFFVGRKLKAADAKAA